MVSRSRLVTLVMYLLDKVVKPIQGGWNTQHQAKNNPQSGKQLEIQSSGDEGYAAKHKKMENVKMKNLSL